MSNGEGTEGRVAVVTGAARGIGRAIALTLAGAGFDVALADVGEPTDGAVTYALASSAELEDAAAQVRATGRRALAIPCDVSQSDQVRALMARARDELGSIDLLVNNAGIAHFAPLPELDEAHWDRLFAVNVKGVYLCSQAALPALLESGGSIVNLASVAGKRGSANGAGYCGTKFAVVGITQSLAAELGPQGVRVNAVCPGILATHMWTDHLASEERGGRARYDAVVARSIPLRRDQTPQDVAEAVLYLATAPNVTGVSLNVAGGMEFW